jgi:putative membrane protein
VSEKQRLHPAAMIGGSLKALPGAAAGLIGIMTATRDEGLLAAAGVFGAIGIGLMIMAAIAVLSWRRFTYELLPDEIIIEQGIASRKRRVIPFDRVQDVAIERPLLARLIGTARVRIETGGSASDEGKLDMVALAEAQRLRDTIRGRQERRPIGDQASEAAAEEVIVEMAVPRVMLFGLLNFSLLFIVVAVGVGQYLDDIGLVDMESWLDQSWIEDERTAEAAGAIGLQGLAIIALLMVLLGFVTGVARTLARDFGFRLTASESGLRRRRGLFTLSEVLIPARRTQAARLDRRWLSGWLGYSSLSFQTLGADPKEGGVQVAAPFARAEEIDRVLARADFSRPPEHPPHRTPRRALLRRCGPLIAAAPLLALLGLVRAELAAVAIVPLALALYVALSWSKARYGVMDDSLVVRSGLIRRRTWVIPYDKLQTLTVTRGPLQRALGLATLAIDTAGAPAFGAPEIPDLFVRDAEALARALLDRFYPARVARKAAIQESPQRADGITLAT